MPNDHLSTIGIVISVLASFAAMGGWIAHVKRRSPLRGSLLGLLTGPIGVYLEMRAPHEHRPMVDPNAWNSLRSMVVYQDAIREYSKSGSGPKRR